MAQLTISQVARQIGLRPSAVRYYERIGLLPPAQRLSRQRRYEPAVLYRLAIIHRARQLGFTLSEIRHLFFGFRNITRPSERWRTLSQRKLAELDRLIERIKEVQGVLKLISKCRCDTLHQCGEGVFQSINRDLAVTRLPESPRRREKHANHERGGTHAISVEKIDTSRLSE